jgi:hypothetical protein
MTGGVMTICVARHVCRHAAAAPEGVRGPGGEDPGAVVGLEAARQDRVRHGGHVQDAVDVRRQDIVRGRSAARRHADCTGGTAVCNTASPRTCRRVC